MQKCTGMSLLVEFVSREKKGDDLKKERQLGDNRLKSKKKNDNLATTG